MLSKAAIFNFPVQADWVTFVVTVGTAGAAESNYAFHKYIRGATVSIYTETKHTDFVLIVKSVNMSCFAVPDFMPQRGVRSFFRHDSRGTASGVCYLAGKLEPVFPAAFLS